MNKFWYLSLVTLLSSVSGQSFVTLFLPNFDPMPLTGSIISTSSPNTIIAITCGDSEDCGLAGELVVTFGPSTVAFTTDVPGALLGESTTSIFTLATSCVLSGTVNAVCTGSPDKDASIPVTNTFIGNQLTFFTVPLTSDLRAAGTPSGSMISTDSSSSATTTTSATTSATSSSTTSGSQEHGGPSSSSTANDMSGEAHLPVASPIALCMIATLFVFVGFI